MRRVHFKENCEGVSPCPVSTMRSVWNVLRIAWSDYLIGTFLAW